VTRRNRPQTTDTAPGGIERFGRRVLDDARHDPYQPAGKYSEPTNCPSCGAIFREGRWQWGAVAPHSHLVTCPACRRIKDRLPAGTLTLEGPYVQAHGVELLNIASHQAELERKEHPLHRIIRIDQVEARIVITTTDLHLPRRIGEAVKRAHDGVLDIAFGNDEYVVRVRWSR
jgi:hypothetical protein